MALTIGPETSAPVFESAWLGTTTAMATLGWLAGAKAIIQSVVVVADADLGGTGLGRHVVLRGESDAAGRAVA